jgi:hypothetical protein
MRHLLCCLISLHCGITYCQNSISIVNQKAKIYLIGIVHTENKYRNADSLYNILLHIKPDVILSETDTLSGYFKPDFTMVQPPKWYTTARKLNMGKKMPPEMEVLYTYKKSDSSVIILPFDIDIINRKKTVLNANANEVKWIDALNKANKLGQIPTDLKRLHENLEQYTNYLIEQLPKSYRDINRKAVSDSMRQLLLLENEYYPKVIDAVPELKKYKNWYAEHAAYWQLRNKTMCNNILQILQTVKAKKMVVFTGLLHKYYLTDLLTAANNNFNFELVEYYHPDLN